jgi:heme-degrading monooxygenase HmoA
MTTPVVRVWKGYGTAEGVERYCREHFATTVLPRLQAIDGFLAANVLTRTSADETEVVVATVWDSAETLKAFAGDNDERAVVEPIVHDLLTRFDEQVTHFTLSLAARVPT